MANKAFSIFAVLLLVASVTLVPKVEATDEAEIAQNVLCSTYSCLTALSCRAWGCKSCVKSSLIPIGRCSHNISPTEVKDGVTVEMVV